MPVKFNNTEIEFITVKPSTTPFARWDDGSAYAERVIVSGTTITPRSSLMQWVDVDLFNGLYLTFSGRAGDGSMIWAKIDPTLPTRFFVKATSQTQSGSINTETQVYFPPLPSGKTTGNMIFGTAAGTPRIACDSNGYLRPGPNYTWTLTNPAQLYYCPTWDAISTYTASSMTSGTYEFTWTTPSYTRPYMQQSATVSSNSASDKISVGTLNWSGDTCTATVTVSGYVSNVEIKVRFSRTLPTKSYSTYSSYQSTIYALSAPSYMKTACGTCTNSGSSSGGCGVKCSMSVSSSTNCGSPCTGQISVTMFCDSLSIKNADPGFPEQPGIEEVSLRDWISQQDEDLTEFNDYLDKEEKK